MKELIVNADDFGLDPLVNEGIMRAWRNGFVTSTSVITCAPAFDDAVERLQKMPLTGNNGLGTGIHLTLVGGLKPVLPAEEIPTLLTNEGVFPKDYKEFAKMFYFGGMKITEIQAELEAQIDKGIASGLKFTHLDSHQHVHVLPGVQDIAIKLCRTYSIPAMRVPAEAYGFFGGYNCSAGRKIGKWGLTFWAERLRSKLAEYKIKTTDHFFGMAAGGNLNEELVGNILKAVPEGTSEIMTHPGISNTALAEKFPWDYHWEAEMNAFTSPVNLELLEIRNIKLRRFDEL